MSKIKIKLKGWRIMQDMIGVMIGRILKRKRRSQTPAGVGETLRCLRTVSPSLSIF